MAIKNGMRPIHPGEMLREEYLVPLNMSAETLAKAIGVSVGYVDEIVKERQNITADMALRLGKFFKTTPKFWLNIQQTYDLRMAEQNSKSALENIRPFDYAIAYV